MDIWAQVKEPCTALPRWAGAVSDTVEDLALLSWPHLSPTASTAEARCFVGRSSMKPTTVNTAMHLQARGIFQMVCSPPRTFTATGMRQNILKEQKFHEVRCCNVDQVVDPMRMHAG